MQPGIKDVTCTGTVNNRYVIVVVPAPNRIFESKVFFAPNISLDDRIDWSIALCVGTFNGEYVLAT